MLLAIDIGNTNITIGGFEEQVLKFTSRLATDHKRMEDQYAIEIRDILDINGVHISDITGSVISSVAPGVTGYLDGAVKKLTGIKSLIVGPGVKTGLNIKIDNPAQLGADLVAVSVAALAQFPSPNVVCDLGTATTLTVLDRSGSMIGGIILAGVKTGLNALVSNTSLLQQVSCEAPERVIGRNTIECMQSGVVLGTAAMLDGLIERIEQELGCEVTAIATGGLAPLVVPHCKTKFILSDNLVLEGLRIIYHKNI
ncbi:MAG: type III pantothenate kinase [Clostridia bacterium]|nr:type III pantothenate kinase [Clostridia bacterium]